MLNGGGLNFKNLGIFFGCVLPNFFNAKYNNQRKSHGCFNFFSTRCRKISAKNLVSSYIDVKKTMFCTDILRRKIDFLIILTFFHS